MRIGIDASRAFEVERTGTETYSYQMIRHILQLPEAGKHEWYLYVKSQAPSTNNQIIFNNQAPNTKFIQIPLPFLWTQTGLAARTWIDKLDCLWVPAHTLPLLRKPDLKTLVTVHGIEYEWLPAYESRLQRWYLPWSTIYAVKTVTKVIAVSDFTKGQLVERLGADPARIQVVHEGVSFQALNPKHQYSIFNKFKIIPEKYLLFIGTVQPRKNLARLIEAFSRIRDHRGLRLVIAGKLGWQYEAVLAAPEKFGVKNRVVFTGYITDEEKEVLLRNALVYVQPSITEGFGLPVLEAFAAGVPVISSDGGALKEILNFSGFLFDPFETEGIKKSLELVLGNKKIRRELVDRGRERLKDFSWVQAARQTLKLFETL